MVGDAGIMSIHLDRRKLDPDHCDKRPIDMLLVNNAFYSDRVDRFEFFNALLASFS